MAGPTSILLGSLALAGFASHAWASIVLEDIRTTNGRGLPALTARDLTKRDLSAFDLKSTETFLWGANREF